MKKWLVILLLIGVGFFSSELSTHAEEKVMWDGAEVVKDQTGKMAFTKDIKVYKKDSSGKFVSMTVKKGNYLRVYDIEKYGGKVYYWMSSGYRVLATDLVVFKEVPMNLRFHLYRYTNWDMIVSSREGILNNTKKYGEILKDKTISNGLVRYGFEKYSLMNGKLQVEIDTTGDPEGLPYHKKEFISGSDLKMLEKLTFPGGYYIAKQDPKVYEFPLLAAKQTLVEQNTLIYVYKYDYNMLNSFVNVAIYNNDNKHDDTVKYSNSGYMSIKDLKPIEDIDPIGTYYITQDIGINSNGVPNIPRNAEVTYYITQGEYGIILYKDKMYVVKLTYLSKIPLD